MQSDAAVLASLLNGPPATKAQIGLNVGLSKPTTAEAVGRLITSGLLREDGARHGHRGRSPVVFHPEESVGLLVGLDIGGSNLRVAICDAVGTIKAQTIRRTIPRGGAAVAQQSGDLISRSLHDLGADSAQVLAFGVSSPGVLDPGTGLIRLAYNLGQIEELDLLKALSEHLDFDALIENNVNCSALGEQWRGCAVGLEDFVFLSVGAGVGMGVVSGGRLVRGRHGAAGEAAYLPISADPFETGHRRRGALEDEASASGILNAALRKGNWPAGAPTTVEELFHLADEGVPDACSVVAEEGRLLGLAAASVAAIVDPAVIVLGGGIGSNPLLRPLVQATVDRLLPFAPTIATTSLAGSAGLHGALAIARKAAYARLIRRAEELERG